MIGGGQNCEHDVSVASAASVRSALDPAKYEPVSLTIGRDGTWYGPDGQLLDTSRTGSLAAALDVLATCDVVLPLVHGPLGEDGTLAGLCELAGVPYVGSPLRAGALAMDKWTTKLIAEAVGVRTARGSLVTNASTVDFTGPVVVKPVAAGSSFGVALVEREEDLELAVQSGVRTRRPRADRRAAGRPRDRHRRAGRPGRGPPDRATAGDRGPQRPVRHHREVRRQRAVPHSRAAGRHRAQGARGRGAEDLRGARLPRARQDRLLPHRGRSRAQRGQHHAGHDIGVPGAQDVPLRSDCPIRTCWTRSSAEPPGEADCRAGRSPGHRDSAGDAPARLPRRVPRCGRGRRRHVLHAERLPDHRRAEQGAGPHRQGRLPPVLPAPGTQAAARARRAGRRVRRW